MKFSVVTLFPEMIESATQPLVEKGLFGAALAKKIFTIETINPRKFASGVHQGVDDRPFGGSDGMIMKTEYLAQAVNWARQQTPNEKAKVVYLSPQGKLFDQSTAQRLVQVPHLILVSGRYGGVDERFVQTCVDEEISIGDYVLSGGELAVLVLMDAVARQLPGVLGNQASPVDESHTFGLLEFPQYTRPREWNQRGVPAVLFSGNHELIKDWRLVSALLVTRHKRPDLYQKRLWDVSMARQALIRVRKKIEKLGRDEQIREWGFTLEDLEDGE